MKKISVFLCVLICLLSVLGCSNATGGLVLVCPDGAPAISAYALKDVDGISYTVYPSATATASIQKDVVTKRADIAILPVNLASKLCVNGEDYRAVGVLTHGNLYGVSKNNVDENGLKGKTVGVIQLSAVPGYTVKLMLTKLGLQYTEDENAKTGDNVYLYQIPADATAVKTALDNGIADVCIVAEPMCSRLVSVLGFERSIDVQSAYGSFPQAVMVVKTSVLANKAEKVNEIISALDGYDYTSVDPDSLVGWINSKTENGAATSLSPAALSVEALDKSNIRFAYAWQEKENVKKYLSDLKVFDTPLGTVAEDVSDNFFWSGV